MINQQRICDEFARQAAIDSPSFKEAAMNAYLEQRFAQLGVKVEYDNAGAAIGSNSNNMLIRYPGSKAGAALMITVHSDTVTPADNVQPLLKDGIFTSAGDTILGADDKAGIAALIEALEVLKEQQIAHVPLEIVITICEEQGLLGAKQIDPAWFTATQGIALDTTGTDIVINKAPGANRFEMTIQGLEAHAGVCPEQGISAIQIAGKALARMPLGRIDDETTANIGTIHGGQATNIVPATVKLRGEVRSHNPDKLAALTRQIISIVEEQVAQAKIDVNGETVGASLALELHEDFPAMQVAADAPVVSAICAAGEALGRPQQIRAAGGGSDANIFNQHGVATVIMATGMSKVHTINEQLSVADLVKTAELLVEVIRRV